MKPDWWPDWEGQICVIVASGPSAAEAKVEQARGRAKVIAINSSIRLAPWADALYGADYAWWRSVNGMQDFPGLRITADRRAAAEWELARVEARQGDDRIVLDPLGTVGWGSNSGFHVLNLAVQFRCRRIILVGFDMRLDRGVHWHGPHPRGLNNPRVSIVGRWRRAIDGAAKIIAGLGIEVVNASPVSALEAYPKMTLSEAIDA